MVVRRDFLNSASKLLGKASVFLWMFKCYTNSLQMLYFIYRSFTSLPLQFDALSVKLKHEVLHNGPIALEGNPAPVYSTSVCEYNNQGLSLLPEDHLRLVIFTLDPTVLGSTVEVRWGKILCCCNRISYLPPQWMWLMLALCNRESQLNIFSKSILKFVLDFSINNVSEY